MNMSFDLTLEQVAGRGTVPLVAVKPFYEYKDGVRGNMQGYKYTVLLPKNQYQTLDVGIEGEGEPAISQEELDRANESLKMKLARFEGFKARPYSANGVIKLSARADRILLVEPVPKQPDSKPKEI